MNLIFLVILLWQSYTHFSVSGAIVTFLIWLLLLPPLLTRVLLFNVKLSQSKYPSNDKVFVCWWLSVQLQTPFLKYPAIEETIRYIPGLYSAWLRLWGAKIGKGVFWSPQCIVVDRPFLEIGDHTLLGMRTKICSHFINKTKNRNEFTLYLKPVVIGAHCTVGGNSILQLGTQIKDNACVKAHTIVKGADL